MNLNIARQNPVNNFPKKLSPHGVTPRPQSPAAPHIVSPLASAFAHLTPYKPLTPADGHAGPAAANNNRHMMTINTRPNGQTAEVRLVPEGLITKEELAKRLRKSIRTIETWQRRRLIPFIKVANSVLSIGTRSSSTSPNATPSSRLTLPPRVNELPRKR